MHELSNYPPGVTGLEDQISGPKREQTTILHDCDDCGCPQIGQVLEWSNPAFAAEFICGKCGGSTDISDEYGTFWETNYGE